MTSRQKNKQPKVTPEFLEALGTVLGEFANCDLEPRCDYYRDEAEDEGGAECADELEAATHLLADWYLDATGNSIWYDCSSCPLEQDVESKPSESVAVN
jgi:hypothetical protein